MEVIALNEDHVCEDPTLEYKQGILTWPNFTEVYHFEWSKNKPSDYVRRYLPGHDDNVKVSQIKHGGGIRIKMRVMAQVTHFKR